MIRRTLNIVNEKGLHARASAKFVECAERFDAAVLVHREGMTATGDSIMGLLMLGAARGTDIEILCSGPQAEQAAEALTQLVANRFDEDY